MSKIITVQEGGFIYVNDFKDLLNIDRVEYYSLKHDKKEGILKVTFYDKRKKPIKPYGQK